MVLRIIRIARIVRMMRIFSYFEKGAIIVRTMYEDCVTCVMIVSLL